MPDSAEKRPGTAPNPDPSADIDGYDLHGAPGHLLRRWQQRAVELYMDEVGEGGPTPRQFAVLITIHQNPGLSQTRLVTHTGIDRSTIADMLNRLAHRQLVRRARTDADQRTNALHLTDAGVSLVSRAVPAVDRAQERILAPVPPEERPQFLHMLARILQDPEA